MKKSLITGAFAMLMLASCGSDSDTPAASGSIPLFSASIEGQNVSRAFDTTWENGDAIGISGISGDISYSNVLYNTTGNGDFEAAGTEIYFQDNNPVTFTAYYPYAADVSTITADTWNQQDQKKFDYLWAQAQGSKANPGVSFVFSHKMSKLALTIRKGDDVNFNEVKAAILSLEGFRHEGYFDTATGVAATTGNEAAMWEFANNTSDARFNAPAVADNTAETITYSMILFPQEFDAPLPFEATLTGKQTFKAGLDFTTANAAAGDADAANKWIAGRQYNLSVTLHKTAITVDNCTITPWTPADGGNIDAN